MSSSLPLLPSESTLALCTKVMGDPNTYPTLNATISAAWFSTILLLISGRTSFLRVKIGCTPRSYSCRYLISLTFCECTSYASDKTVPIFACVISCSSVKISLRPFNIIGKTPIKENEPTSSHHSKLIGSKALNLYCYFFATTSTPHIDRADRPFLGCKQPFPAYGTNYFLPHIASPFIRKPSDLPPRRYGVKKENSY